MDRVREKMHQLAEERDVAEEKADKAHQIRKKMECEKFAVRNF